MPQLHLYVPEHVADEVKRRADAQGISASRYLAELVTREVANDWPPGFFEQVVGGWAGDALQRPEQPAVEERAPLAPRGRNAADAEAAGAAADTDAGGRR